MWSLMLPELAKIYVDANTVIYRVERIEPFHSAAFPAWETLDRGGSSMVTSELTSLEVLVKPMRVRNDGLVALYRRVLSDTEGFTLLPVDRDTIELATRLRANHRLRLPMRSMLPRPSGRMSRTS